MQINISGNTATITSTITPEQIAKVQKLQPELLVIKDKETKRNIFLVSVNKTGNGFVAPDCAVFVPGIGDKLVVEVSLPVGLTEGAAKSFIYDYTAKSKAYIEEIEQRVADNINGIVAAEKEFLDSITIG